MQSIRHQPEGGKHDDDAAQVHCRPALGPAARAGARLGAAQLQPARTRPPAGAGGAVSRSAAVAGADGGDLPGRPGRGRALVARQSPPHRGQRVAGGCRRELGPERGLPACLPAQPQVVYLPSYDPLVVYGPWWWPAYRPVYCSPHGRATCASIGRASRWRSGEARRSACRWASSSASSTATTTRCAWCTCITTSSRCGGWYTS